MSIRVSLWILHRSYCAIINDMTKLYLYCEDMGFVRKPRHNLHQDMEASKTTTQGVSDTDKDIKEDVG